MPTKLALAIALLLPTTTVLAEDATHLLRYQFKRGEVLRWEVDQRSSVRSRMEGASEEAQTKTVSLKSWRILDVTPEGEIELLTLVERVRMENKLPDRATMVFDSTDEGDPPAGFEDAARAVGVPLSSIRLTPRGEVVERTVKHHQPAADPHEQVVMLLPEGPIAIGDSWSQPAKVRVRVGDGGSKEIKCRRKYTLSAVKSGVATIATEFQVLSPTTPEIDGQLVHRLVKGEIRFDLDAGRPLTQRLEVDRRVLGFAGQASSMHLISRTAEKLQATPTNVASKP